MNTLAPMAEVNNVRSSYQGLKQSFERELEVISDHMRHVTDKIGELHRKYSNLEA